MWNFIKQWSIGLQPSLNLSTEADGSISIRLDVTSSPSTFISEQKCYHHKRRRSGQQSRSRRRKLRAQARQSLTPIDTSIAVKGCDDPILTVYDASENDDCTANYFQDINYESTIVTSITEAQDQECLDLEFGEGIKEILDSMSEIVFTEDTSEQINNCDQEAGASEPSWSEIL